MYYGYYMLPDGTYCMAPPPPGVDANSYYSNSVSSATVTAPSTAAGVLPNAGTTVAPPETVTPTPQSTASSQVTASAAPTSAVETR